MGYGQPAGLIEMPPPAAALHPPIDVWALKEGDRVNVAGKVRVVKDVVFRGAGRGLMVQWRDVT